MTKNLTRSGNSEVLVISKEMKAHQGLSDDRIEVLYTNKQIVLKRPESQTFDEAVEATFEQYGVAMKNLA